jgi:acyl-coenzyme A synthetase/AMP-(fatty) acid ligase
VTKSKALLYHPQYSVLCKGAQESLGDIPTLRLGPVVVKDSVACADADWPRDPQNPQEAVSHVFHTSGTSGTPKPIPQTHDSSVVTLPRRQLGEADTLEASFTTTPLFHGGVSDLLRAWMARSLLYLYPSSTTAVTAANIMGAYRACSRYPPGSTFAPPITAFLSVPYILTLLSPTADPTDAEGATAMLANMEIVSTGGAPLDTAVGNGLVQRGVHLTSRLGSSECGCAFFFITKFVITDEIFVFPPTQSCSLPIGTLKPTGNGSG